MTTIRPAQTADVNDITEIFNEAILKTTASFFLEPRTVDDMTHWLTSHDQRHPVIVAELSSGVVGWASLTKWSEREAYDGTAETSFYVRESHRGQGIGRQLKRTIIEEARRLGYHTLIARMAEGSDASRHLNEQFGFQFVGTLKEVGLKFGQLLDVHIYQLMLKQ